MLDLVLKFQTYFSQNIFFICCNIFFENMVICLFLKHVPLGFNISSFKMDLTIFVAQPVSISRAKLWKIVVKCEIVMFLTFGFSQNVHFLNIRHFILPSIYPINSIFFSGSMPL